MTVISGDAAGLSTGARLRASYAGGCLWVRRRVCAVSCLILFTHRFALQGELVGGMHDLIQDCVGQGRVAQVGVPVPDRKLAGDQGCTAAYPVVEEFEQSERSWADGAARPQSSITIRSRRASYIRRRLKLPSACAIRNSSKRRGMRT